MPDDLLIDGPADATTTLVLAHGAGAPMDSAFMDRVAHGLGTHGVRVVRFEFDYMARRRTDGVKRPPEAQAKLLARFTRVIDRVAEQAAPAGGRLALGGKSMGGRMATLLAAQGVGDAVAVFGYPFHPPGKPERLRLDHFPALGCPVLIAQGSRDPFGTRDEVAGYPLPATVHLHWAEDGNHDLKPRKASGRSHDDTIDDAVAAVARFLTDPGR
ncbi:alpha/beta hydrolase [Rhodothalassium salexigens]|uniref:alpha/beta family hydrolase n=1 Tax=Rhodothalassium salexigens TaxID=1086 RepID=UPI0019131FEA|nr:alpha/beta family hydrolase [Rhodothalassium salexigens]MBK5920772.1 alpha/beta hydrolase [Rhodothalassium salexigens]